MNNPKNILIRNIGTLYGLDDEPYSFKKGKAQALVQKISNAYLYITDGLISDFGTGNIPEQYNEAYSIDAQSGIVTPAYVDSHTHIVFATSRDEEYRMRLQGATYEEIAASGGGILNSAAKLRNTPEEELLANAYNRLQSMIQYGTGVVEIKSGYGLDFDSEIKMLRVIRSLKCMSDAKIVATFLGAHAVPAHHKHNRSGYIKEITEEMLPAIADQGLADYCDVFCDEGFYTVEETELILNAAAKYGLKPKIHANELGVSGGVQVGIKCGAISVDHLECTTEEEWKALSQSNTIPTLLPGTSYYLGIPYAEGRKMIDYGLGVVLASDFNPGSTPSGNMHFLQSLACNRMKLLPEEAFNAVTLNAAHALECQDLYGSITKGKLANVQIMKDLQRLSQISYYYGQNHSSTVILEGKVQ